MSECSCVCSSTDFATIRRNVEISNVEARREVGKLPLGAGLQIDRPEIFVMKLSAENDERPFFP